MYTSAKLSQAMAGRVCKGSHDFNQFAASFIQIWSHWNPSKSEQSADDEWTMSLVTMLGYSQFNKVASLQLQGPQHHHCAGRASVASCGHVQTKPLSHCHCQCLVTPQTQMRMYVVAHHQIWFGEEAFR